MYEIGEGLFLAEVKKDGSLKRITRKNEKKKHINYLLTIRKAKLSMFLRCGVNNAEQTVFLCEGIRRLAKTLYEQAGIGNDFRSAVVPEFSEKIFILNLSGEFIVSPYSVIQKIIAEASTKKSK